MKRTEIHDAAKAFVTDHSTYIQKWAGCWERAMIPLDQNAITNTDGVPHPEWDKLAPEVIVDFFNAFWMALPDSPRIHTAGFGALCDIAEHVFGFDDDDEPQPAEV